MYREICAMFARYNGWANERVYAGAAGLSEEEFGADRGVFFGSMRGTLNHLLVADRVWMRRFTGEGPAPKALDTILHEDLPTLHSARRQEDARMREWITGLTDADIDRTFTFRTIVDPRDMTQKLGPALAHVFNHQTHHRGQAHAILTGFGRQVPSLDVITFQRETGAS